MCYIYVCYICIYNICIYIYILHMYIILDFVPRIGSRKVFYRKNLISHSKKNTLFSCNYFQAASTVLGEMGWKAQQRAAGRCWVWTIAGSLEKWWNMSNHALKKSLAGDFKSALPWKTIASLGKNLPLVGLRQGIWRWNLSAWLGGSK